jgi:HAD superfamily hydrolase (TIGR01544 family)
MLAHRGTSSLQVISDFDYTMTQFYVSPGRRGASCHCLIEDCGFLPSTYQTQAKALFHYYYPLEVSSTLTVQEKIPHMQEWVEKAHDLLLLSKLRQTQIKFAVAEALSEESIALRSGVTELIARLQEEQVPVLLFSAGG